MKHSFELSSPQINVPIYIAVGGRYSPNFDENALVLCFLLEILVTIELYILQFSICMEHIVNVPSV